MEMSATPLQQLPIPVTGKRFRIRAAAYIIDSVAYFVGVLAINFAVGVVLIVALTLSRGRQVVVVPQSSTQYLGLVVGVLQFAFYFFLFDWLYGATIGKLILRMRVIRDNGAPCDFRGAFMRALLLNIDGLFFGLVGYSSMKAPLYQRHGDKSGRTIVVGSKATVIQRPRAGWWFLVAIVVYSAAIAITAVFLNIGAFR